MELRRLGTTEMHVTPIAMGCWPIAGLTSAGVTEKDSLATLAEAFEVGINHFDTAYCYGIHGESERLIGRALGHVRASLVIATKGGIHWGPNGKQARDATPSTLRRECEESLRRLGTDHVDLLYLHAPYLVLPVAESAGELRRLMEEGKARAIGASNCTLEELKQFAAVCPLAAFQPKYNMLQREIEADVLPWCQANGVSVMVYWPLLKGLLAGKLERDHQWDPKDGRPKYPMFQGEEWEKNHDLIDALRPLAREAGKTVAQLVLNWTIHQPGITSALCGAKRRDQICENSGGAGWTLTAEQQAAIAKALARRGTPVSRNAV